MSEITIEGAGGGVGGALNEFLMAPDIEPGTEPGYSLAKTIYISHPLGGKLVDKPIAMAQSEQREITVQDAPDEVLKAFQTEWEAIGADEHIANVMRLSRIYGIGSLVLGCEGVASDEALDMTKVWDKSIFINALDPLNTAGSLVLNQISTAPNFQKPTHVSTSGQTFHRSRYCVVMNEAPIFISYTNTAFGFVGRSVYQRALYPLKSFIKTMIADDAIATKLALIIAKRKPPGSTIDRAMLKIADFTRNLLKIGKSGDVLQIGVDEEISAIDMQNVDGAGRYSRGNIIKNIATAADMPATLLDEETLVEGFGEGTEDAKQIVRYINGIRRKMQPVYAWFDNLVRYRAWNPQLYKLIQAKYPEAYGQKSYEDAFFEWRTNFSATWPSLLIEPQSEQIKVESVKFETIIATLQTLLPSLDASNRMRVIQWAADNLAENKMLFEHELQLDYDSLETFLQESEIRVQQAAEQPMGEESEKEPDTVARKLGKFDSAESSRGVLQHLKDVVSRLPERKKRAARADA